MTKLLKTADFFKDLLEPLGDRIYEYLKKIPQPSPSVLGVAVCYGNMENLGIGGARRGELFRSFIKRGSEVFGFKLNKEILEQIWGVSLDIPFEKCNITEDLYGSVQPI